MKKHVNIVTLLLVVLALASLAASLRLGAPLPSVKGFFGGG